MSAEESFKVLSSTVSDVIDEFLAEMRDDADIDGAAVDRLGLMLKRGTVPKPEELAAAVFGTAPEREP